MLERKAPDQKRRKLRLRSARNISLTPRSRRISTFSRADMNKFNNIGAGFAPTFGNFLMLHRVNAASMTVECSVRTGSSSDRINKLVESNAHLDPVATAPGSDK